MLHSNKTTQDLDKALDREQILHNLWEALEEVLAATKEDLVSEVVAAC